jgi:hypothetical protein
MKRRFAVSGYDRAVLGYMARFNHHHYCVLNVETWLPEQFLIGPQVTALRSITFPAYPSPCFSLLLVAVPQFGMYSLCRTAF